MDHFLQIGFLSSQLVLFSTSIGISRFTAAISEQGLVAGFGIGRRSLVLASRMGDVGFRTPVPPSLYPCVREFKREESRV